MAHAVLLVDDERFARTLYSDYLRSAGYEVEVAEGADGECSYPLGRGVARGSDLRRRVDRVAHAMEEIRDLAARLPRLERPDLERLDRLTEDVARACRALAAAARNSGTKS